MARTLFLVLTLLASNAVAQGPRGHWRSFINSTTPTCMIGDGPYLWIGTHGGLARFDKQANTFSVWTTSNSNMPQNWIYRIARDKEGGIWAMFPGAGVARFQNNSWTVFSASNSSLPNDNGPDIAVDSLDRVWVATNGGLGCYDHGTWRVYNTSNSPLTHNSIYSVACDKANNVWIACKWAGDSLPAVFKFDGASHWESHSIVTDSGYYFPTNVFSMMVARDSSVWLGMEGYVAHIKDRHWRHWDAQPSFNGPMNNYVFDLVEDSIGGVWGTDGYGIAHFDGTAWRARSRYEANKESSYPFERGRAIVLDGSDLWATGYEAEGIARLRDTTWTVFGSLSDNSLGSNGPKAMTRDSRGNYWFGMRFSPEIDMFDGTTWHRYDSLAYGEMVMAMAADSSGNVWIGTGKGFVKFNGNTVTHFDMHAVDSFSNLIYSLMWDEPRHALWVGNGFEGVSNYRSGIARYDGLAWKTWIYPDVYPQVMSIERDTAGRIWAAPYQYGIYELNGDIWQHFTTSNSTLPNGSVEAFSADRNGGLWIATDGGPAHWDGSTWQSYSGSGIVSALAAAALDAQGNVWLAGAGASVFSKNNWSAFTVLNSSIGSQAIWSAMADADGNVWFGTNGQGLVEFIPDPPAGVLPSATKRSLTCYPNPANSTITVVLPSDAATVRVLDLLGREQKRISVNASEVKLDLSSLTSGRYLISAGEETAPIEIVH